MPRKYESRKKTDRLNDYAGLQIPSTGTLVYTLFKDAAYAPFFDATGLAQQDFTIVNLQLAAHLTSDISQDPGLTFPISPMGVAVSGPNTALPTAYTRGRGAVPYHLHGLWRPWGYQPGSSGKIHRVAIFEGYTRKAKAVRRGEQLTLTMAPLVSETEKLAGDMNFLLTAILVT